MDFTPTCRRCHTQMQTGQAILPALGLENGLYHQGYTYTAGTAPLSCVWKCPECGHSFAPGQPPKDPDTALILRFPAVHEFELAHTMNRQIHHDPNRFTRLEILASYLRVEAAISHPQFKEELLASYRFALALRNSR